LTHTTLFDDIPGNMGPVYDIGDTSPTIYRVYKAGEWRPGSEFMQTGGRLVVPLVVYPTPEAARFFVDSLEGGPFVRVVVCRRVFSSRGVRLEVGVFGVTDPTWEFEGTGCPSWIALGDHDRTTVWERLLDPNEI
jgi:hypothetical protein